MTSLVAGAGHACAHGPCLLALLQFALHHEVGLRCGRVRHQHADVLDLRQPVGEPTADVSRHPGDERIVARVRDRHHGDRRGAARKDQAGAQRPYADRAAQNGEGHGGGKRPAAPQAEIESASCRFDVGFGGFCPGFDACRLAGRGVCRRCRDGHVGHLGLEQIAAAGDHPDHLALVVAERGADFADALKQAVLADMDVRPDRFHQLLLAENAPRTGGEQPQHLQRLGPELAGPAVGAAQFGAFRIRLETRKAQHVPSNRKLSHSVHGKGLKPCPNAPERRISEKF